MLRAETIHEDLRKGLTQSHLPAIDGIRAVAVFLVIFYHGGLWFSPGGLGVLIFFVISGFLITWLLLRERDKTGGISLKRFYARRSLRIFPAFYIYSALLIIILTVAQKRIVWPQTIAALFYVNNYYQAIHGDPSTGFSHTWSLAVEEQFYLLWPGFVALLTVRKRSLIVAASIGIIAVWVHRAVLQFAFGVWQGYFYEAFDTRFDHLAIGCLLAILLYTASDHPFWKTICDGMWKVALALVLLAASAAVEYRLGPSYRDSAGFIVNPLLTAILIPQLIANRAHFAVAWLQSTPVRFLGRISYSLYLYHQIVLGFGEKILHKCAVPIQLFGSIALLILVASGSYFFIERPFLGIKDRRFASVPRPRASASEQADESVTVAQ